MARANVKELKVGQRLNDFYLVKSKRNKTTKNGKPYLDLDLADRTGTINAKVWDNADRFSDLFQRGDAVKVRGLVEDYQGKRQLKVQDLRAASDLDGLDMSELIKVTPLDPAELEGWLRDQAGTIEDPHLAALMDAFFSDGEFMESFRRSAAARNVHHVYVGGLLEHTVKVTRIALFAAEQLYPGQVDRDLVLAGAILHDVGKTRELSAGPETGYTTPGYLLGHIMIGAGMVRDKAAGISDFPEELLLRLLHTVVAHHGEKEFGSPVVPMTAEAMIINGADNLDAKTQIALTAIDEDPNKEEEFTEYHRTLARHFYKGAPAGAQEGGGEGE